jgi:hypothetical protein
MSEKVQMIPPHVALRLAVVETMLALDDTFSSGMPWAIYS